VIDANGNPIIGVTDESGNFRIEIAAGEAKLNSVVINGLSISIPEIIVNVTIGEIYNFGTVGVDRIT
jgi:hypothetical protein